MEKMKLRLEELKVETFEAGGSDAQRGTVRGLQRHQVSENWTACPADCSGGIDPCSADQFSCAYTCDTCAYTCNSTGVSNCETDCDC